MTSKLTTKDGLPLNEARVALVTLIEASRRYKHLHVPFLLGPVGLGKSTMVREAAEELDMPLIQINCGDIGDPSDMGIFFPGSDENSLCAKIPDLMVPATKSPHILFFDDVDKAPAYTQSALLSVVERYTLKGLPLAEGTVIVLAGNRTQDDISSNPISESLLERVSPILIRYCKKSIKEWGSLPRKGREDENNIHPHVLEFVVGLGNSVGATESSEDPYDRMATPRGFQELSELLYATNDLEGTPHAIKACLVGSKIGHTTGVRFLEFLKSKSTTWRDIIALDSPEALRVRRLVPILRHHSSFMEARKEGASMAKALGTIGLELQRFYERLNSSEKVIFDREY